ncbi:MAG TPA: hypothetical protein VK540_35070 [Polyangiaceae bacterium]|jgi:hypothetical protein|nr:hypothetical protein [Polyangiaceae bacterium]
MKKMYAMLLPLFAVFALGCSDGAESRATQDSAEPASESAAQNEGDSSSLLACGYKSPPRCGPRNCVAMCVTCLYDICRATGGSCTDCKRDMELCKDDCGEQECPPSNPFCDFEAR